MMATEVNNLSPAFTIFIVIGLLILYVSSEACPARPCDEGCPDDMERTHGDVCARMCNDSSTTAVTCYSGTDACYGYLCIRMLKLTNERKPIFGKVTGHSVEIVWHQSTVVVDGTGARVWYFIVYGNNKAAVSKGENVNETDPVVHNPEDIQRRTVVEGLESNTTYYFKVRVFQVLPQSPETPRTYCWPSEIVHQKTADISEPTYANLTSSLAPTTRLTSALEQTSASETTSHKMSAPMMRPASSSNPTTILTSTPASASSLPSAPTPIPAISPTPTPAPTLAPNPKITPAPIPTPTPTSTSAPTSTPTPEQTPTPAQTTVLTSEATPESTTTQTTSSPPFVQISIDSLPWIFGIAAIILVGVAFTRIMKVLKLKAQRNHSRSSLVDTRQASVARVNINRSLSIAGSTNYHDTALVGVEYEEVPMATIASRRALALQQTTTGSRRHYINIDFPVIGESSTDDTGNLAQEPVTYGSTPVRSTLNASRVPIVNHYHNTSVEYPAGLENGHQSMQYEHIGQPPIYENRQWPKVYADLLPNADH